MKQSLAVLLSIMAGMSFGQIKQKDYYFTSDTTISEWYVQPDVLVFRTVNDVELKVAGMLGNFIEGMETLQLNYRPAYVLKLRSGLTTAQTETIRQIINQINNIENELFSYSTDADGGYASSNWYPCSEVLLISFDDINIQDSTVNEFMERNNLELQHKPSDSLPPAHWTWIFTIRPEALQLQNTFQTSRSIHELESEMVYNVQPSFMIFKPDEDNINNLYVSGMFKLATIGGSTFELIHPMQQEKDLQLLIYNSLGQKTNKLMLESGVEKTTLNFEDKATGAYQLYVMDNNGRTVQSFRIVNH